MSVYDHDIPDFYAQHGLSYWSHSRITKPLPYFVAEYLYRQPRFFAARNIVKHSKHHASDVVAEAENQMNHYKVRPSINMRAGTLAHSAAFAAANDGAAAEHIANAIEGMRSHSPARYNRRDIAATDWLLSDDCTAIDDVITHAIKGIREAFGGANMISSETQIEFHLPQIEIPIVGYADGLGGGVLGELKTKWGSPTKKGDTSGWRVGAIPGAPVARDIAQMAIYQRGLRSAAGANLTCKLIYANARQFKVFALEQEELDEALEMTRVRLRQRQELLRSNTDLRALVLCCEPDWGEFFWRDYSPELMAEIKEFMVVV